MARNWIKIETVTPDKPEICAIATHLKIDPDAALGKLVRLWAWAEVNKVDGNAVNVTREFIDKVVGQAGFAEALEVAGWLSGSDQALVFTRFSKHNGKSARDRALTAERVTRHRERKRDSNELNVTNSVTKSDAAPAESNQSISVKTIDNELKDNVLEIEKSDDSAIDLTTKMVETAVFDQSNAVEQEESNETMLESAKDQGMKEELVVEETEGAGHEGEGAKGVNDEVTEKQRPSSAAGTKKRVAEDPPEQAFLF